MKIKGSSAEPEALPIKFDVSIKDARNLMEHLESLVLRTRALVDLKGLQPPNPKSQRSSQYLYQQPLVERLHLNEYEDGLDLSSLVTFPPKLQPIPIKPLFFDLAWNYIDYPGRTVTGEKGLTNGISGAEQGKEAPQPAKRGWFGFGR